MIGSTRTLLVVLSLCFPLISASCQPRDYGLGSQVCVDDLHNCDLPGPEPAVPAGHLLRVTSDKAGQRFNATWGELSAKETGVSPAQVVLTVDRSRRYQTIEGFGGAFTDAAALNIRSLPATVQRCILRSYFGPDGISYTMGRVPIAGSDFSTRAYTYDDLPDGDTDEGLENFKLQPEDWDFKIPLILDAQLATRGQLKLVGSVWSAPVWMKTNNRLNGKGKLQRRYWETWAEYIIRFLQAYLLSGIPFWAVTSQNEPLDGLIADFPINAMGWTVEEQTEWVGRHFGPALQKAELSYVKIFVLDDNRLALPQWLRTMMANNITRQFVSGVAVHWYSDFIVPATVLDTTHKEFPQVPLLYTEACTGQWPWQPLKVVLGSWQRAQYYLDDLLDTLNHWSVGWIDWNLAVDTKGGPNWASNFVDAPIVVNAMAREAYKQPMFYAIGHVTKFVRPGSVRVRIKSKGAPISLQSSAFERKDGSLVLVILNKKRSVVSVEVKDGALTSGPLDLPASSITTLVLPPARQ